MPILKASNVLTTLQHKCIETIAINLDSYWNSQWDEQLVTLTEESQGCLLPIPPTLRYKVLRQLVGGCKEFHLFYKRKRYILLSLLDHKSFSDKFSRGHMFDFGVDEYDTELIAMRCKEASTLHLDNMHFLNEVQMLDCLKQFSQLTVLSLQGCQIGYRTSITKLIGAHLQNIEELTLGNISQMSGNCSLQPLVPSEDRKGCPELRILRTQFIEDIHEVISILLGCVKLQVLDIENYMLPLALDVLIRHRKIKKPLQLTTIQGDTITSPDLNMIVDHCKNISKIDFWIQAGDYGDILNRMLKLTEVTLHGMHRLCYISPIFDNCQIAMQLTTLQLHGLATFESMEEAIKKCVNLKILELQAHYKIAYAADIEIPADERHVYNGSEKYKVLFDSLEILSMGNIDRRVCCLQNVLSSPKLKEVTLNEMNQMTDSLIQAMTQQSIQFKDDTFRSMGSLKLISCDDLTVRGLSELLLHSPSSSLHTIEICYCDQISSHAFEQIMTTVKLNNLYDITYSCEYHEPLSDNEYDEVYSIDPLSDHYNVRIVS